MTTSTRWLGRAALLTLGGGCFGGQTGDAGDFTEGGDAVVLLCCISSTRDATLEEALAFDPGLSSAFDEALGGTESRSFELLLFGPPQLWTDRGSSPPADRATPVTLTLRATGRAQIVTTEDSGACTDHPYPCESSALLELELVLDVPELNATSSAAVTLRAGGFDVFDLEGLGETCYWRPTARRLNCGLMGINANADCFDRDTWIAPPVEPRTGIGLQELFDVATATTLGPQSCRRPEDPDPTWRVVDVIVPERYCRTSPTMEIVPGTVVLEGDEGRQLRTAIISLRDRACYLKECSTVGPCEQNAESPPVDDRLPQLPSDNDEDVCSRATALWSESMQFGIEVDDDGVMLVTYAYQDFSLGTDAERCWSQGVVK